MNLRSIFLIVALAFLSSKCRSTPEPTISFIIFYKNESDYIIDMSGASLIKPGEEVERNSAYSAGTAVSSIIPYCIFQSTPVDIYFKDERTKDKSYTKHIYYNEKKGFRPRDPRNPKEYRYEKITDRWAHFYYTVTNEDYENVEKNQNATPTPIRPCRIIESMPGKWYKLENIGCWEGGEEICYNPCGEEDSPPECR